MDIPDRIIEAKDARLFRADVVLWDTGRFSRFDDGLVWARNPVPVLTEGGKEIGAASLYVDDVRHQIKATLTFDYHSPERLDAQVNHAFAAANLGATYYFRCVEAPGEVVTHLCVIEEVEVLYIEVSDLPIIRTSGGPLIPKEE